MIGALAIKNRRKKQGLPEGPTGPPPQSIYFQRCHLLYVIAVCGFIVGLVLLIPGCLGDKPFFIYAGSSLGISVVCFLLACLLTPLASDDEEEARRTNTLNNNNSTSGAGVTSTLHDGVDIEAGRVLKQDLLDNGSGKGTPVRYQKPKQKSSVEQEKKKTEMSLSVIES